jgi:hypothetical protein
MRPIVFIDIAGCTFIFKTDARSQELEVRILSPSDRRKILASFPQFVSRPWRMEIFPCIWAVFSRF